MILIVVVVKTSYIVTPLRNITIKVAFDCILPITYEDGIITNVIML